MNKNTDKYFRTTSFYLASFLFAKGLELANIDRTDTKKCVFLFTDTDTPLRELLVGVFNYGKEDSLEVMVDPRKLITAIKTLKQGMYQDQF